MNPQPIKGKLPLLVALLILVLSSMWLLNRCSHRNDNSIVETFSRPASDTLVVAIEMSPATYSFVADSASGFDYELLEDICRTHDIPVVFHPFAPLDYALDGLKDRKFDLVVAAMPASLDLKDEFLLTDDVYLDQQVLVRNRNRITQTTDSTLPPQMQLLGDTVWIASSSPFRKRLQNLSHELGDTIYVKSNDSYTAEHLVILTALGEIPQTVVNSALAKRLAKDYPDLDVSTPISMKQFQPWIIRKDLPQLRDSLNQWLKDYKSRPEYDRLLEKYM